MNRDIFERRPVILLVVLVTLFFWKLAFSRNFTFLDSPDLANQVLPWYQVQARAWHNGEFPLWDPHHWGGQPLLGQVQPGAAFPLNWPLFLTPLRGGLINLRYVHWHFVLMHLLAALFMYALARQLGRSRFASLLAGVAFTAAGHLGSINWPQMLNGAIWIPLVFLFFHKAQEAGWGLRAFTHASLCGGTVGLALLSGHHQAPTFIVLALTGLFLYFVLRREKPAGGVLRFSTLFALIGVVAFLVSALQLLPAFEYGRLSYRWVGAPDPVTFDQPVPYYVQYGLRTYPVSVLGLVVPRLHFESNTYVGLVVCMMALLAVALCWQKPWVRIYSGMAALGLAYSFGPFSILHGWVYNFIPMADKARNAGQSIFVFQFALILLAAYGVDRLLQRPESDPSWNRWVTYLKRGLMVFGALTWIFLLNNAVDGNMSASGDPFMIAALLSFLLAATIHGFQNGLIQPTATRAVLLAVMVFELASPSWFQILHRDSPQEGGYLAKYDELSGVIAFLRQQPKPFRYRARTDEPLPNLGSWVGVDAVDGYLASISEDIYDYFDAGWEQRRLMMNTVYVLTKDDGLPDEEQVYSDHHGWKIYKNPNAWARSWIEHTASNISSPDGAPPPPPAAQCQGQEQVSVVQQSLQRVTLAAGLACPGYVILSDTYFPGWQATVDGADTTIYRAYGGLRGIHVPAGQHNIEFAYKPLSVYAGGALTAAGFALCGLLTLIAWRRGELRSGTSGHGSV